MNILLKEGWEQDSQGQFWFRYTSRPNVRSRGELLKCGYDKCASLDTSHTRGLSGKNHYAWKGGKNLLEDGYIEIFVPNHPLARGKKYVREHRLVVEAKLNKVSLDEWIQYGIDGTYPIEAKFLKKHELVHHKNGIKDDNRPENLEIVVAKTHFGNVECPFCQNTFKIK